MHRNGHGITRMRLWSSVMMQNIRTKLAEEKWSLRQHNFLAGSRKTVPLAGLSEDCTYSPTQSRRRLPPLVKATVRILSSRTDLPQSLSILLAESQRSYFFRHQLCPKWKRNALTPQPGHTAVTAS